MQYSVKSIKAVVEVITKILTIEKKAAVYKNFKELIGKMKKFSVLMSLYNKEQPEYLKESLNSVLNQTVKASQIVIVKDGPLTQELEAVLESFVSKELDLYTVVPLARNQGLGLALQEGMLHCDYELVARMDTDDIARKDRFELQLAEFEKDPTLDICSSHVLEFEGSINNIVAQRTVPLTDFEIKKYQKRRDSFNHPAVMFKKSKVLESGNYQNCPLMEDTYLWVNMFLHNAKAKNIDDFLLYFRVGKDMFQRRGGWKYHKKYKQGRKMIYKTGYISWWDYHYTILVQLFIALMPNKLRGFVFKKLLHRGKFNAKEI